MLRDRGRGAAADNEDDMPDPSDASEAPEEGMRRAALRSRRFPVEEGQTMDLAVETMADGPDGLARVRDYVVFVERGLPGERVEARIVEATRKYARAEVAAVLRPSADRTTPLCPHFGRCGGCHLQHLAYAAQLQVKTDRVVRTLRHALRAEAVPVEPMVAPDDPWGQRAKVVLHVQPQRGGYRAGLFGFRSRRLEQLDVCPAADPSAFRVARAVVDVAYRAGVDPYDERTDSGFLRSVVVRSNAAGKCAVVLVGASARLPRAARVVDELMRLGLESLSLNVNRGPNALLVGRTFHHLAGAVRLEEEVEGVRYLVSPGAFFQTSRWGAGTLVRLVKEMLACPPDAEVLDVYSGGGLFALALAPSVRSVIAIEDDPRAAADAIASAALAQCGNVTVRQGPAALELQTLAGELLSAAPSARTPPYAAVLDPPRSGCHRGVLEALGQLLPRRVVYVSCDLESFARDAAALRARGFTLARVVPVDMFPHSDHIETVSLFHHNPQVRFGKKSFSRSAGVRLLEKAKARADGSP
jgi:23S rRNA (uracil-5-)-methyltransferase RumA